MAKDSEKALECCGLARVNGQGQMQIPKDARETLGLDAGTRLMVFTRRSTRELIVTPMPLDEDLHRLATEGDA